MRYQRVHNCCSKRPVKRGLWSPDEDLNLIRYIRSHGAGSWPSLPDRAGLERCGKSCRLRWMNYLRPGIKRGKFSQEEENAIICLHTVMENRWAQIAKHLPGRTDSEIKNYWHSRLKKKKATIASVALNPFTHGATDSNTVVDLQYHSPSVNDSIASLQHFTIIDSELQSCVESLQMNELAQGSNNNSNFLESAFGQGQDFPLSGQRSLFSNVFSEDLRSISDVMGYMQSNHES